MANPPDQPPGQLNGLVPVLKTLLNFLQTVMIKLKFPVGLAYFVLIDVAVLVIGLFVLVLLNGADRPLGLILLVVLITINTGFGYMIAKAQENDPEKKSP